MSARNWTRALLGSLLLSAGATAQVIESFEGGIPGSWSVVGKAGTSGMVATVAPTDGSAFAWLSSDGPLGTAAFLDPGATFGSSMESAPIALTGGSELSLDFDFLARDQAPFTDWVVVQLLDHTSGAVVATMANGQIGADPCAGDGSQVVPALLSPPPALSPGVVLTPPSAMLAVVPTPVIPGEILSFCGHTGWITASVVVPYTGSFRLRFIATDVLDGFFLLGCGVAIDNIRVNSVANQPPVADAGDNTTIECTSPSGEVVMLDGTGSSDPDGDSLTFCWNAPAGVTLDDATLAQPTGTFPLGSHNLVLTVTDPMGNTDSDTVTVLIQDTIAPGVDCSSDTSIL